MQETPAALAMIDGLALDARDVFCTLHRQRRLLPVVRQAALERVLLQAAAQAGLSASAEEVQQAADRFRARHGLHRAEDAHAWLAREGWTVRDWEAALEQELLAEKASAQVIAARTEAHFQRHRSQYERAELSHILVGSEAAARELLRQLDEETTDFATAAARHSQDEMTKGNGGRLGTLCRCQLPAPIAGAVFAAAPEAIVGPVASRQGVHLFHVHARLPAALDDHTQAVLRQRVQEEWVAEVTARMQFLGPVLA